MGCGLTKTMTTLPFPGEKQRRDTAPLCVDDLKYKLLDDYQNIIKRFGHPQYYKNNGYTLGVRVDGVERYQTFYVGHCRSTHGKVTVKEHHMANSRELDIIQEVLILAKLSHPSIPALREIFITDWSLYMVIDKLEPIRLSDAYDFRPNHKNLFSLQETKTVIKSLIEAVDYCHSQKVIVRNLTPKNISAVKNAAGGFDVKICDFSMAVNQGCTDYVCESKVFNWGQVPFLAPEALLGNEYSYAMDMWSIGVLLFMMVTYSLPFQHDDDVELMHRITYCIYEYPNRGSAIATTASAAASNSTHVPSEVKHLISQLLYVAVEMRLTDKEALNNAWLNSPDVSEENAAEEQQLYEV